MQIEVIYEESDFFAVFKPPRLLVHQTNISTDKTNCVDHLRERFGPKIYPIHRLDRGTTGVLLFAKNSDTARIFSDYFASRQVQKLYYSINRGWPDPSVATIDHAIDGKDAVSSYQCLASSEMPYSIGRYPRSRYSLTQVRPKSGRMHQIRRHFTHIDHPIIGDRTYGDRDHNNFFRDVLKQDRLFLWAQSLIFPHPITKLPFKIDSTPDPEFQQAVDLIFPNVDLAAALKTGLAEFAEDVPEGALPVLP